MDLDQLNRLPAAEAVEVFRQCCASQRWAEAMTALRPFRDAESLAERADEVWAGLDEADWLEAFAAHPRIGERADGADRHSTWSRGEQSGMADAEDDVRTELAAAQATYEDRFDRVFLVCATGLSATDMLGACRERLGNDAATELEVAAEEQRKITRLRLEKLLG